MRKIAVKKTTVEQSKDPFDRVYGKGRDKYRIVPNPDKNSAYYKNGFEYMKDFVNGSGFLYLHKNRLPKEFFE